MFVLFSSCPATKLKLSSDLIESSKYLVHAMNFYKLPGTNANCREVCTIQCRLLRSLYKFFKMPSSLNNKMPIAEFYAKFFAEYIADCWKNQDFSECQLFVRAQQK